MKHIALTVLVVLATSVVPASAATSRVTGCPPTPHYKVVAEGPRALVASHQYEQFEATNINYRACLRSTRRSYLIAQSIVGIGGVNDIRAFRFAGRFVAWSDKSSDPRYGGGGEVIRVFDLRSGKKRGYVVSEYYEERVEEVADLVVSTRGYVAWVMRNRQFGDGLYMRSDTGYQKVDQGDAGTITITSLEGTTLRWTRGGEVRQATVVAG